VNDPNFERFLAKLYTDDAFRARFLRDPAEAVAAQKLTAEQAKAVATIDTIGLAFAARSFAAKRRSKASSERR
jgi:putative modified peptide